MTTITSALATIVPTLVDGYTATSSSNNIEHKIIGRPDPDVSLAEDDTRTGSLTLVFAASAAATAARKALRVPAVWTLSDPEVPEAEMRFVRQGDLGVELHDETRAVWIVTVGFREVLS